MKNKPDFNSKHLKKIRKELRNNLTPAEARMWMILKGKQLFGKKFRRQHSIDHMIVDFYCPKEKLVIELDGEVHNNPISENKDELRDQKLNDYGIIVLRFENRLVFEHPEIIIKSIQNAFNKSDF